MHNCSLGLPLQGGGEVCPSTPHLGFQLLIYLWPLSPKRWRGANPSEMDQTVSPTLSYYYLLAAPIGEAPLQPQEGNVGGGEIVRGGALA